MNTEDLWDGANKAAINARNLFRASEALCDLNHYGPATSLAILAAEEAIKAMTYAYCSIAESGNAAQIKQDLLSHATKHELGLYYYHLHHMSSRVIKFSMYLYGRNDFTDERKLKIITGYLERYKSEVDSDKYNEIKVVTEWKKNANRVKNECLYVGQYKGHWRNPSDTSIKTYKKQKKVCLYFVEAAEASILNNEVEELRAVRDQLFG